MSKTLTVRNLGDDIIARLKLRAARHGRSAEAEVRAILSETLGNEPRSDFWSIAAELRRLTRGRKHTAAEALIREGRNER